MPVILNDLGWMSYNVFLALLPVLFAYIIHNAKKRKIRWLIFPLWLAFLPNTLYLLTDLIHVQESVAKASGWQNVVLLGMYAVLIGIGCLTYVLACLPFFTVKHKNSRTTRLLLMVGLNFLIGVGIVLGRVFRFNSWDLIFRPLPIFHITREIFTTASYLSIVLLFTLCSTLFYISAVSWYKNLIGETTRR